MNPTRMNPTRMNPTRMNPTRMNPTRTHLPTSWAATLPILLHAIEHGDDDSRATARAELIRLAEIADCAIERDRAESMGGQ